MKGMAYTTISLIRLGYRSLAHGRRIYGEFRLVDEFVHFFPDTVSNGTRVNEDDDVPISLLNEIHYLVEDKSFDVRVVCGWFGIKGR